MPEILHDAHKDSQKEPHYINKKLNYNQNTNTQNSEQYYKQHNEKTKQQLNDNQIKMSLHFRSKLRTVETKIKSQVHSEFIITKVPSNF